MVKRIRRHIADIFLVLRFRSRFSHSTFSFRYFPFDIFLCAIFEFYILFFDLFFCFLSAFSYSTFFLSAFSVDPVLSIIKMFRRLLFCNRGLFIQLRSSFRLRIFKKKFRFYHFLKSRHMQKKKLRKTFVPFAITD
jgi:hypothetical protein